MMKMMMVEVVMVVTTITQGPPVSFLTLLSPVVAAMFLGPQQQALLLPSAWPTAVLSGWVAWLVVTHLLLELLTRSLATGDASLSSCRDVTFGTHGV